MNDLSISGLDAGYGGQPIISGFSLPPLTAGEVVSVVGPNGAGKSTLLRSLAGLIPAHGSIRLDEAELTRLSLADRAKRVTYMPQTLPQGVALTVLETVVASIRATPLRGAVYTDAQAAERAYEVLQRINAEALAVQRLDRLSGGQKQLAGLAQALAREPRLLLLDEPTSALDLHYQLRVLGLAREAAAERGMTVMIVLHDLQAAARVSDRIAVMAKGRLVAFGTPDEAITPDILAEVYRVSARVQRCDRGALQVMIDDVLS
ncbi:ABC transporter ATP-binding protein [Brevundimonas diminuta]|uniref:ABC transporter ATP-binding protein n=1 Tax=Brevundimonas diminuta TaxID=293 RepID=UPI000207F05F|nr:ABC transporter ATP-binding protein [Brevundimonas diminuta]EGF96386.1 ABC transporter family protein [Brevundimonas diminuta ATCC 11568]OWR18776.1 ABC transporter ATP-binding protein [Brevundimonas diminuta]WQE44384.1 ABC transporter ATP-binding protein [Brevundimonas diminuta]SUW16893.1 Iron(3+)-hydroxamate import ATP-binding protein FhuC [Brevundimonas diminuta]